MKRIFRSFMFALPLTLLPFAPLACSDDDDGDDAPAAENAFLGTWILNRTGAPDGVEMVFKADGAWTTSANAFKAIALDPPVPRAENARGTYVSSAELAFGPMEDSDSGPGTMTATLDGSTLSVDLFFAESAANAHVYYSGVKK